MPVLPEGIDFRTFVLLPTAVNGMPGMMMEDTKHNHVQLSRAASPSVSQGEERSSTSSYSSASEYSSDDEYQYPEYNYMQAYYYAQAYAAQAYYYEPIMMEGYNTHLKNRKQKAPTSDVAATIHASKNTFSFNSHRRQKSKKPSQAKWRASFDRFEKLPRGSWQLVQPI